MQIPVAAAELKTPSFILRNQVLIAILLLTVLLYLPSLWFPFVYDDFPQILDNPRVRSWNHLPSYFTDHVWAHRVGDVQAVYYRPLFLVWLLANFTLFGANPVGWHLTTILVHVLVVGLVYAAARRLLPESKGAAWVALLFALHPAQTESVAWISGVPEPLAATFLLGAFVTYLRAQDPGRGRKWWVVSLALYFAGLLCKETAVIFPAAVVLHRLCGPADGATWIVRARHAARAAIIYVPALITYVLLRTAALEGMYRTQPAADGATILLTLPLIAWTYLRLLLFPFRLAVYYDVQFIPTADARFWLPLLGAAAVVAATLWWVRRSRFLLFAAGWTLIFLVIPAASVRFFSPDIGLVHDRYLYLSLFGFALLAVAAWQRYVLPVVTGKAVPVLALLALVYAYGTFTQQFHWRSGYAIFQRALELYPDPRGPLKVLVAEQLRADGRDDEAGRLYREAFHENANWHSIYGMASWLHDQGQHEEAEKLLLPIVPQYPNRYRQYFLLGMARVSMGRYEEAVPALGKGVLLAPGSIEYRLQLARALYAAGMLQPAIAQYEIVLEQNPREQDLRNYVTVLKKQVAAGTSTRPGREKSASPPGSRAQ